MNEGKKFTHLGLFEGIGGFSLAASWMGWETVAWCEWNEFGQKILRHYFPEAEGFGDITKTDFKKYANRIDVLTGGFPCQPYSLAGKRKGKEDERHLWPEMLRAISDVQPTYVVGENVFGLINWNAGLVFDEIQSDLEAEGYEVWPYVLPACGKNAPHRRNRVWFVAYSSNARAKSLRQTRENTVFGLESVTDPKGVVPRALETTAERIKQRVLGEDTKTGQGSGIYSTNELTPNATGSGGKRERKQRPEQGQPRGHNSQNDATNANGRRQPSKEHGEAEPGWTTKASLPNDWKNFPTQSPICGGNDGIPAKLDGITLPKWRNESIKAFGNAIVPQVALEIFIAINGIDSTYPHINPPQK